MAHGITVRIASPPTGSAFSCQATALTVSGVAQPLAARKVPRSIGASCGFVSCNALLDGDWLRTRAGVLAVVVCLIHNEPQYDCEQ